MGIEVDSGDNTSLATAAYDRVVVDANGAEYYPYSQQNGPGLNSVDSNPIFGGPLGSAQPQNNFIEGFTLQVQATAEAATNGCSSQQIATLQAQLASITTFRITTTSDVYDPNSLDSPTLIQCAFSGGVCNGSGTGNIVANGQTSTANWNQANGDGLTPGIQFANSVSYITSFFNSSQNLVFSESFAVPADGPPGTSPCPSAPTFTCGPYYVEFADTMTYWNGTGQTGGPGAYKIPVTPICTPATTPPDHNPLYEFDDWFPTNHYFFTGAWLFRFDVSKPFIDLPGVWIPGFAPGGQGWYCTKNNP
jgi:hypothetical protein